MTGRPSARAERAQAVELRRIEAIGKAGAAIARIAVEARDGKITMRNLLERTEVEIKAMQARIDLAWAAIGNGGPGPDDPDAEDEGLDP